MSLNVVTHFNFWTSFYPDMKLSQKQILCSVITKSLPNHIKMWPHKQTTQTVLQLRLEGVWEMLLKGSKEWNWQGIDKKVDHDESQQKIQQLFLPILSINVKKLCLEKIRREGVKKMWTTQMARDKNNATKFSN